MGEGKLKAIVFEDNVIAAFTLKIMIEALEHECLKTYDSADKLLEIISKNHADYVLMDIMLRGEKTGIEAVEELRSHFDVPVLFVSALNNSQTVNRIKEIRNTHLLSKPYTELDLEDALKELLGTI